MANEEQLKILKLGILKDEGVGAWNNWRKDNRNLEIDLANAVLRFADLTAVDLTNANLNKADLRCSRFFRANLNGINLCSANLISADFFLTKLKGADLSNANLLRVQALYTSFNNTVLTGACIEDWNINSNTNFDNVICDYIYLKQNQQERRPSDPNRNFEPGEFAKLVQKSLETVDLIFSNGIDWKAFLSSYQDIQVEYGEQNVSIQAIEKKSDGAFVIRLDLPTDLDKAKIEESFWKTYKPILQAKDEQLALYGQVLEDKLKENTKLLGIIETMANREDDSLNEVQIKILKSIFQGTSHDRKISESLRLPIRQTRYYLEYFEENGFITAIKGSDQLANVAYMTCELTNKGYVAADNQKNLIKKSNTSNNINNFNAPVGSVDNKGTQTNVTGLNEGTQIGTQYNSPQKKTLAEAADEIQKLLKQLKQSNPNATIEQQEVYVDIAMPKTLKERLISALSAMSDAAIEEFLKRPGVKVVASGVRAWILPE